MPAKTLQKNLLKLEIKGNDSRNGSPLSDVIPSERHIRNLKRIQNHLGARVGFPPENLPYEGQKNSQNLLTRIF